MVRSMQCGNLLAGVPEPLHQEQVDVLVRSGAVRVERILSRGQVSEGWYDQEQEEWVALLSGQARIAFEHGDELTLRPGDWVLIRAHQRHRVTYTSVEPPCVWVAMHFPGQDGTTESR